MPILGLNLRRSDENRGENIKALVEVRSARTGLGSFADSA